MASTVGTTASVDFTSMLNRASGKASSASARRANACPSPRSTRAQLGHGELARRVAVAAGEPRQVGSWLMTATPSRLRVHIGLEVGRRRRRRPCAKASSVFSGRLDARARGARAHAGERWREVRLPAADYFGGRRCTAVLPEEAGADALERLGELARDDPELVRLALGELRQRQQVLVGEQLRVGVAVVDGAEDRRDGLASPWARSTAPWRRPRPRGSRPAGSPRPAGSRTAWCPRR